MKNRIAEIRKKERMSQTVLAKKIGISKNALSKIETEQSEPRLSIALKIEKELKTEIHKIFIGE